MAWGWLITACFIYALIPGLDFLNSLVVAACVSPTDPILAQAVVGGPWAESTSCSRSSHAHVRVGCNDGAAFPFLYLALYLTQNRDNRGHAVAQWFYETWHTRSSSVPFGCFDRLPCPQIHALFGTQEAHRSRVFRCSVYSRWPLQAWCQRSFGLGRLLAAFAVEPLSLGMVGSQSRPKIPTSPTLSICFLTLPPSSTSALSSRGTTLLTPRSASRFGDLSCSPFAYCYQAHSHCSRNVEVYPGYQDVPRGHLLWSLRPYGVGAIFIATLGVL